MYGFKPISIGRGTSIDEIIPCYCGGKRLRCDIHLTC